MPVTEAQIQAEVNRRSQQPPETPITQPSPDIRGISEPLPTPTPQVTREKGLESKQGVTDQDIQAEITRRIKAEQQSGREQKVNQLFEQLGGKIPSMEPEKLPFLAGGPGPLSRVGTLKPRQEAFRELQDLGFTREQIDLSLRTKKILDRPRIGRTVGGMVGPFAATAIAGRAIPGPIDDAAILTYLIAAGGAGTGGVAGEAIQTGIEEKRLIGRREALKAFAIEAGTEVGGRAVVGVGKLALSPFIRKVVPEAAALVDDFAKVGGTFSPSELDKRFSLRISEAFSRGSFGAKEIFQEFEEKQGRAVLAFADNIIESIGEGVARETPEKIGEIFAGDITRPGGRVFGILDDLFDPLYKQVDDLAHSQAQRAFRQVKAGGPAIRGISGKFQTARELQRLQLTPKVSTKTLKQFAKKHLATDTRLNSQFLSPAGRSKLTKVIEMSDEISFSDMRTLRSSFLKDTRKLARDVDQSEGIIKQLVGVTDKAIFDPKAAKNLSGEALNLLENTNRLYRAAQEGLKTTFSEKLAKRLLKNPSGVIKEVFPNNNPKAIRLLRKSLIEPISGKPSAEGKILWNQLRQAWLADAVDLASKEGVAKPKVFNNQLLKMGKKGLREMFPENSKMEGVKKIRTIFEIAGKTPPTGASLFSRGAQIGGLAMMYNSGKEGDFIGFTAGATLAVGPLAFAKLATNPRGIKFLTRGFKMKPGASGLVPLAVRMVKLVEQIAQTENRQRQTLEQRKLQEGSQREQKAFEQKFPGFGS